MHIVIILSFCISKLRECVDYDTEDDFQTNDVHDDLKGGVVY